MKTNEKKDSLRGNLISKEFGDKFKNSKIYKNLYSKHLNELIIGVRDGYINLYYNCDSIAKISATSESLEAEVNEYYAGRNTLSEDELISAYEQIKIQSDKHISKTRGKAIDKSEKQAQERLFIDNNNNPDSKWYCIDVEYTKSLAQKDSPEAWRFDIIAITKEAPFRVALIELKYGSGAISSTSGIRKHIKDYVTFHSENSYNILKPEIVSIINGLKNVGVAVPETLGNITIEDLAPVPEYYFITLNNNPKTPKASTPQMTMGGYLLGKGKWNSRKSSSKLNEEGDIYEMTKEVPNFKPVFMFSPARLPEIGITDILDSRFYTEGKY